MITSNRPSTSCVIYDLETLSLDPAQGVAVHLSLLPFTTGRFADAPYTVHELLTECRSIKFDIAGQVASGRVICPDTLKWWQTQPAEAQAVLVPDPARDKPLAALFEFWTGAVAADVDWVITRRATIDEPFLKSICAESGNALPYAWWKFRELVSLMDGMVYGQALDDKFIPREAEGVLVPHIAEHDIVTDTFYRMQTLARLLVD